MTKEEDQTGVWLMLDAIPVLPPWQMPDTFSNLLKVCRDQSYDLRAAISEAVDLFVVQHQ